jgi:hypothetical protein
MVTKTKPRRIKKRTLLQQVESARMAAVPLLAVSTKDPAATVRRILARLTEGELSGPALSWDRIRGLQGLNDEGTRAVGPEGLDLKGELDPVVVVRQADSLPADSMVFMLNTHRLVEGADEDSLKFIQGVWNLRDTFKTEGQTLFLVGPSFNLPPELAHDVLLMDESLPTDGELEVIVRENYDAARAEVKTMPALTDEMLAKAVNAGRGIPAFPFEQAVCMSLTEDGLDDDSLWARKLQAIASTPGATAWLGGMDFDGLGGLDYIKHRFRRIIGGRRSFRVVVWLDEGEKDMAGTAGDTSGTSHDQLKVMLTEMQDRRYTGAILVGAPGAAKSAFAQAVAVEAGVLCIRMDMGALKAKHVGESERRVREFFSMVETVAGDSGAFFIMTSNDISIIKPELKRRFKKGIWFFDLPSDAERAAIVKVMSERYPGVDAAGWAEVEPKAKDWTGAEVEACFETAWDEGCTLLEASESIIPVAVEGREAIEHLRRSAHGRYNSTSHAGPYTMPGEEDVTPKAPQPRKTRVQRAGRDD